MYVAYATNIYKATYKVLSKNLIKVTLKKLALVLKSVKRLQGAMPTVAFFGFLRCGEFTVRNASDFDVTVNLCISYVLFYDDYAVLKLKESKTDPFRLGICIQLHKINHCICPFLILQKYIASRIERRIYSFSCDPLFITEFGQPLDRNYFIGKLKHVLQLVRYDSSLYNGHSFRSGGATSAGQALIGDNMIKTLGRWSSQSYCTYIKASKKHN